MIFRVCNDVIERLHSLFDTIEIPRISSPNFLRKNFFTFTIYLERNHSRMFLPIENEYETSNSLNNAFIFFFIYTQWLSHIKSGTRAWPDFAQNLRPVYLA